jgi:hypothetical protein
MGRSDGALPFLTLFLVALFWTPTQTAAQGIFGNSEKDEIEIGRQVAGEIEKEQPVLQDRQIATYINSLGQALVRHSSRSHLEHSFQVINSEEINAFALPGGFIYVNRPAVSTVLGYREQLQGAGKTFARIVRPPVFRDSWAEETKTQDLRLEAGNRA